MALVLGYYGVMKFKKVLKAISATNNVFNNSKLASITIKNNGLTIRNRDSSIINYFHLSKELFEVYEPETKGRFVLLLSDVKELISKRISKLVIEGNRFYFYNQDGKLAFTYELVEEESEEENREITESADYPSLFRIFG
ncbi:MAG: hypothetical protein QXG39_06825 [Candidatus Aenigmatarchaeota archaeon]